MKTYLLLALLVICIFPSIASAQTAEEIIEKNIAARGFTTSIVQSIEINPDMDESSFQIPGTSTVEPAKR